MVCKKLFLLLFLFCLSILFCACTRSSLPQENSSSTKQHLATTVSHEKNTNVSTEQTVSSAQYVHTIQKIKVLPTQLNRLGECSVCHKIAYSHRDKGKDWGEWKWDCLPWCEMKLD